MKMKEAGPKIIKSSVKEVLEEKEEMKKKEKEIIERCEEEVRKIRWQKEKEERIRRKNNIIITGINKGRNVSATEIEEFLKEKIGVEVEINAVWWVYVNNEKSVGAEMKSWEDKMKVMENKSMLKEIEKKIFIENYTTNEERNVRRILVAKAKELRGQGKNVKVGYFRIEVDGKRYIYDEKKRVPGLVEEEEQKRREYTKNTNTGRNARRKK